MLKPAHDQAAGLRRLGAPTAVRTLAITGGKGGIGKTTAAVNLGTALCELGRKVMLLDADLGLANADVLLGLRARFNLEHVIRGDCGLADVIVTAGSGLRLVPASSGNLEMATLDRTRHAGIISAFSELFEPIDHFLIDTAAGINESVLAYSEAAQRVVVLVCDEPAALTDAYGLIKVLHRRRPGARIEVVANMVESAAQGRALYEKLARVSDRFLRFVPAYYGAIPYDDYLRRAVQKQVSVVEAYPWSPSARAFKKLALAADTWQTVGGARGCPEFFLERLLRTHARRQEDVVQ
jgi:flagellar biosynthesis protein FlhG